MNQPIAMPKYARPFVLLVFAGALLFNTLFWREKIALNLALFAAFTIAALIALYKNKALQQTTVWLLLATVCSLAMVVIHNSALLLLLAVYGKYRHRSPVYALGSTLQSFLHFIPQYIRQVKLLFLQRSTGKARMQKWRLALLPFFIAGIFLLIYLMANRVLADLAIRMGQNLEVWLTPALNWMVPQRFLFLLMGLCISGGLLYRSVNPVYEAAEANQNNALYRKKLPRRRNYTNDWQAFVEMFAGKRTVSSLALKYEYQAGLLTLVVLNGLLLLVNGTDVVYLWMNRPYKPGFEWAQYVHQGAEMLVFSIILAMLVVLLLFRGNLNFFSGKKYLQHAAYGWLLQNAFLTASVCLRNYYYIVHMALTYKRIGVFVFAALVAIGLVSVYLKIKQVKSSYYLIKFNAVAAFCMLVLSSCFQWDVWIARYNLAHRHEVGLDTSFLLQLSDHALPVLQPYRHLFSHTPPPGRLALMEDDRGMPLNALDYRIQAFLEEQKSYTWLSWNWADAQTVQQLKQPALTANK
jgi:hypothetical protein